MEILFFYGSILCFTYPCVYKWAQMYIKSKSEWDAYVLTSSRMYLLFILMVLLPWLPLALVIGYLNYLFREEGQSR